MRIGVIMDPIETINPKKDSSLAMMLAAQAKGWEISYMQVRDLYLLHGVPHADTAIVEVQDSDHQWFRIKEQVSRPLHDFDVLLMRKDPPVDSEYLYATQFLDLAEKRGVLVVNNPQALRDNNEKLFATHFPACCPPGIVTCKENKIRAFLAEHRDIIIKPLDSMGGTGIFRVREGDSNLGVICELLTQNGRRQIMAQRFLPEIAQGDKRILLIDGEPIPYALARIPREGENRGNLAAGGQGVTRPLSERDYWICAQVGPTLKARGLLFVGIDVIGDYLTEINITSPTCIREIDRACQTDIAGKLMNAIEMRVRGKGK